MIKFEKFFVFITIISIMSGFFIHVEAETIINNQSDVETMLNALDITLDEDVDLNKEITRAEAAYLVSKFMNFESAEYEETSEIFADVNQKTDYAGSIILLYRSGILIGDENSMFRPNDIISYSELITIMVRAMGYSHVMENADEEHYIKKANEIGFIRGINGVSYDTGVTYGVLKTVIYNALKCKILKIETISGTKAEYRQGDSALNEYFDIWSASGVVTETEVTALMGEPTVSTGEALIGGEIYLADYKTVSDFLGQDIKFYYKYDEKNNEKKLMYIYDLMSSTEFIKADEIVEFKDRIYTVAGGNSDKKMKIDNKADVIYNGRSLTDLGDNSIFVPKTGSVKLVDTDDNGVYELVLITSYKVVSVGRIDDEGVIYDNLNYSDTIETDVKYLTVTDESGYIIPLSQIKQNDIVFAAQSLDREVVQIKASSASVSGKVESMASQDGKNYFVIGGNRYFISDYFYKTKDYSESEGLTIFIGAEVNFRLDPDGKIALRLSNATNGEIEPGYLLKAYVDIGETEETLWLKILTKENEQKRFQVKRNAKVDGRRSGKNAYDMLNCFASEVFSNGTCVTRRSVITYKLDDENKIIEVDYPYVGSPEAGESKNSFHKFASYINDSLGLQQRGGVMSGRIVLANPTWVFSIPEDEQTASDDNFEAFSYNFQIDKWIKFDAYSYTSPGIIMDVMVTHEGKSEDMREAGGVQLVTGITVCLNQDDMPAVQLTIMEGTAEAEYFVDEKADFESKKIEHGDIVRFALDEDGEISAIVKYYDCSEDKVENNQYGYNCASNQINQVYANFIGGIYDINGGIARMFLGNIIPTENTDFLMNKVAGFQKVIYHTDTNTAEVVDDLSSVKTFEKAGNNYARIAASFNNGSPQYMYIYEGE